MRRRRAIQVDIETGRDGKRACQYKKKNKCTNSGMTNVGVQPTGAVAKSCKIMLLTSVSCVGPSPPSHPRAVPCFVCVCAGRRRRCQRQSDRLHAADYAICRRSYVVIQIPAISKMKVNANDPNLHIGAPRLRAPSHTQPRPRRRRRHVSTPVSALLCQR